MSNFNQVCSELVDEILKEDPIDWGFLTVDEDNSKYLILCSMIQQYETIVKEYQGKGRDAMLVAIMTKLALENFCLHLQVQGGL
jgi:hypothetical protein